jgi:hypothetical protein
MIRLGYARNSQRWKLRAALLIIAGLMVTGYLGVKWPQWRARAQMRYWAGRCANYSKPADFVVFDEDESRSAALLASGRGYSYDPFMSGAACFTPAEWSHVPWMVPCRAAIFLHERRAASTPFLAYCSVGIVNAIPTKLSEARDIYFQAGPAPRLTTSAGGWTGASITFDSLVLRLRPDDRLRIFAGQLDPSAGDQFSFIVEVNGVRDTVQVRVMPNGSATFTTHVGQTYALGSSTYWSFDKDHNIFETTNAPAKSTMPATDISGK